jgi:drug/metabolite transporter (DMT)-like permease
MDIHMSSQLAAPAISRKPALLTNPVKGVMAMITATLLLVLNDAVAKQLTATMPVGQLLFWRQLFCAVIIVIGLAHVNGLRELRIVDGRGQLLRGVVFTFIAFLIIMSLAALPLPVVSAVLFMSPVIVAVISGPMLGETVGWRRWTAALVGFAGVLVVLRPGSAAFTWLLLLPLVPACLTAVRDIVTRKLSRTDTSMSMLFWSNVIILPACLASIIWGDAWQPTTSRAAGWLFINALLNLSAHFLMIHALRIADASFVAPYKYSGLIWSFVVSFVLWGYQPDTWTLAGSALIMASGFVTMERKAPVRRTSEANVQAAS